jgi:hypothetical protein
VSAGTIPQINQCILSLELNFEIIKVVIPTLGVMIHGHDAAA